MDSENKYNNYIKRVKVPYLSEYYTIEEVNELLSGKQDTLTTGENIDITNNTISAEGYKFNGDANGGFAEKYKQEDVEGGQILANTANNYGTHAEGYGTTASGEASHSEGYTTTASGSCSHAEGQSTTASGDYGSHSEGYATTASGGCSHAEGQSTTAIGQSSHAEGFNTVASGSCSHAEGRAGVASGDFSHIEGQGSSDSNIHYASGKSSHVEGTFNIAQNFAEHAEGAGNISHKLVVDDENNFGSSGNTIHSVGIGRYNNTRKNALEIMQNADVYIKGIGNYDGVHIKDESGAPSGLQTLQEVVSGKQDKLVAGNNIEISGNTISAIIPSVDVIDDATTETGKTWSSDKINSELSNKQNVLTAGDNIEISGDTINCTIPPTLVDSTVSLFTALWKGTQEEYDNLSEHDPKTMYIISDE